MVAQRSGAQGLAEAVAQVGDDGARRDAAPVRAVQLAEGDEQTDLEEAQALVQKDEDEEGLEVALILEEAVEAEAEEHVRYCTRGESCREGGEAQDD